MPERLGRRIADPATLLAIGMLASAGLLLFWGSKLTFLLDDWEFLLYRPGFTADSILSPHGEHISIAPVLIYKGLLETAGMSSSVPYLAVSVALFVTSALLLFVYLRRRVDPWLALLGAGIVLFLGPAFDDLIWDFQMGFNGSLACGLGALLMLERGDRRGDVAACGLLSLGMTFSSLELPFLAAACVDVLLRPDRLRRVYVVAVPALLYGVWWAGWGHEADTAISLHNAAQTPQFVFDAASAAVASLLGLVKFGQGPGPGGLDWGRPLLIVALALGGWRLHRMGRVPRELWIALALAGTFWVLAGLNVKPGRGPTESRYLLPGAIFVLMIAAELLRGVRVSRAAIAASFVIGAAVVIANVQVLRDAYIAYRNTSDLIGADLGALEIARDRIVDPVTLDPALAGTAYVPVSSSAFLPAADRYGSPADSPGEIAAAPEPARVAADRVLARALGVSFAATSAPPSAFGPPPHLAGPPGADVRAAGSCLVVAAPGAILRLPPGGASIQASPRSGAGIALRRFATASFPIGTVPLGKGQTGVARIPTDRAAKPWEFALRSQSPVTVCGIGAGTR
jgi:hypothetical protein